RILGQHAKNHIPHHLMQSIFHDCICALIYAPTEVFFRIFSWRHISELMDRKNVHRPRFGRSEEHTSELQSRFDLVCRLLLEKKKRRGGSRSVANSYTDS